MISFKNIFVRNSDNTLIQFIRYTFVGGLAFLVDFSTLFLLTEFLKFHYLVSAAIAFVFGLTVNYLLSIIWVFPNRKMKKKYVEFIIFAIIGLVGLGVNELIIWVFTGLFAVYYLLSKIISTIIIYLWNFFARKYILFNE